MGVVGGRFLSLYIHRQDNNLPGKKRVESIHNALIKRLPSVRVGSREC